MTEVRHGLRGRGTEENPRNRFEKLSYERDGWNEDDPAPATLFLKDATRSIISSNDSPDVGFDASVNPYRGCEHGCVYCFARPNHEYLGFSAGLNFETRILVKQDAPELLRRELSAKKWRPKVIALSGATDPYQPTERRLELTRRCLAVLAEFRNPGFIITKNDLVRRDVDLLTEMASWNGIVVFVSVTTLDLALAQKLEPRAAQPKRRLAAIETLSGAGIPVGVLVAPTIPGLTDHEMPSILEASARAGASSPWRKSVGSRAGVFGSQARNEERNDACHRDRRMTKPVARRPPRPTGYDGMGPAAALPLLDRWKASTSSWRLASSPMALVTRPYRLPPRAARFAGYIPLRLPHGVGPLFDSWLETHFPDRKDRVLHRIHSMRGGRMNDPNFNSRMRGQGPFARQMRDLFDLGCRRAGLDRSKPHLSTEHFLGNVDKQQSLFV